jgi:hypothetical protein
MTIGIIEALSKSKIQVLPFVNQITYILDGQIKAIMKGVQDKNPYEIIAQKDQAFITIKNEYLQLINENDIDAKVLYIVSPSYVFEENDGAIIYDDSVIFDHDWNDLINFEVEIVEKIKDISIRNESIIRRANKRYFFHIRAGPPKSVKIDYAS